MESLYTKKDLISFINEPLEMQYQRILAKTMQAYSWSKGDMLICFSGGKDSALILDMWCEVCTLFGSSNNIKVAFANTTNETKNMREYIPFFINRCEQKYGVNIDFEEVRPDKGHNIVSVLKKEGLPFVSKMVSSTIRKVTNDLEKNKISYDDVKDLCTPTIKARDALREMGLNDTTVLAFTGWSCARDDFGKGFVLPKQWFPLLDIKNQTKKDIKFTEKCCDILKKKPVSKLKHHNIMTGEQAVESKNRESAWMKNGCNYRVGTDYGYGIHSKPLAAVSFDAVLFALKQREIPICKDYGDIVEFVSNDKKCYKCSGAGRTGCALCGLGIKFDTNRFIRLQKEEPEKANYAFKPIDKGGLGYLETCQYLNEYCNTKIEIPTL